MKNKPFIILLLLLLLILTYFADATDNLEFYREGRYILNVKYFPQLYNFSVTHNVSIETLQNWIMAESSGRERAFNRVSKDYGLCQLHDVNYLVGKYWNTDQQFDIWNGEHNLFVALAYLSDLIKQFGTYYGFMAYNIGPGRVSRGNILQVGIKYVNRIFPIQADEVFKFKNTVIGYCSFQFILIFNEQILFDNRRQYV